MSIDTAKGPKDYTCSDIVWNVTDVNCNPDGFQVVWDKIASSNPKGFDMYVNSGEIGWFGSSDSSVQKAAFSGFAACIQLFVSKTGVDGAYTAYDSYVKGFYPTLTTTDTDTAFKTAQRVLCVA